MAESNKDSDGSASPFSSFTNRGPNKRKVKVPVQTQLLEFNLQLHGSDSEDDEDFVASSDDNSSEGSETGVKLKNQESSSESNQDDDDDDDGDDDDDEVPQQETNLGDLVSNLTKTEEAHEEEDKAPEYNKEPEEQEGNKKIKPQSTSFSKNDVPKIEILVCGICLETESTEEDELVECDKCGITVHEGCYGDTDDAISESKSNSDAATEPWFCDACKAKAEGICELCPNKGGILKQTNTGRWVHLICALYVPGAGFRDVDKLESVVLEDITASKWGSRRCMLCEDQRFSKTGICIECDAGLCKSYFHALCAQKHGLLTEIPDAGHLNDDDADPLYAHCKMHTEKRVMQARKNGWLAFQSHFQNFKPSVDADEVIRIDVAFARAREEYLEFRANLPKNKTLHYEAPRLLSTCPEVCGKLIKKAELLGYSAMSQAVYDTEATNEYNSRRGGGACQPNLSHGFINHFFKRERWLKEFQQNEAQLNDGISLNQDEQIVLQNTWNKLKLDTEQLQSSKVEISSKITSLHNAFEKIVGKTLPIPSVLKAKRKVKKGPEPSIEEIIHICATCNGTDNQQKMALCDTCNNYYHIHCLDPPLMHLPKKGSNWVWQCTECDESESSDESVDLNNSSTKRPKRVSSAPKKFTPIEEKKSHKKHVAQGGRKRGRPSKDKGETPVRAMTPTQNGNQQPKKRGRKKAKVEEAFENCCECLKEGNATNMVRCDDCSKCYHFECCSPKVKSNPKLKGYLWICIKCTDSDEEEEESSNENTSADEKEIVNHEKEVIDLEMEPMQT